MKILICCENFYPSIGGVQEVCMQLAKRFSKIDHKVYVATSWNPYRKSNKINGIQIIDFKIFGNFTRSIVGETQKYIDYVCKNDFDVILIYAAQQWSCDLLLKYIPKINAKKILVPCGFSKLYDRNYLPYFDFLKKQLNYFDKFIFHTKLYRDFQFIKKNIIDFNKLYLIPNCADENEFDDLKIKTFYKKKFNNENEIIILTNGSFTLDKGLKDVLDAFSILNTDKNIKLYINSDFRNDHKMIVKIVNFLKNILKTILFKKTNFNLMKYLKNKSKEINMKNPNKKIEIVNLKRDTLIELYKSSDIFIFASKIEYSPLVIFEAMASANALISHDVGNVKEIINKTNSGLIVNNQIDSSRKSNIDIHDLANKLKLLVDNKELIKKFSSNGRSHYINFYNWKKIFIKYENIFSK